MSMYQQLVKWCVPIFVMISGAVFLRPTMNNNICRIYVKNILHILVVFIFWSLVYASYQFMISDEPTIRGWVIHFLRGHFHMWFLLLILGLYILVPILRVLVKYRKITKTEHIIFLNDMLCFFILYQAITTHSSESNTESAV
jgi:surface polysaccharide O-acyltransferase-like enzyme